MKKKTFGVSKCNVSRCKTCLSINTTSQVYFSQVNQTYNIRDSFNCKLKDCIYVINCPGCEQYYIGKTVSLRHRMTTHRSNIKHEDQRVMEVSKHLDSCGKGKFRVTPFYRMKRKGIIAHLTTENYFIRKYKPMLNRRL